MLGTPALDIIETMEKSYAMFVLTNGPQSLPEVFAKSVESYLEEDELSEEVVFAAVSHRWLNDMSDLCTYGVRKNSDRSAWDAFDVLMERCWRADDFTEEIHEAATALGVKL